MIHKFHTYPKAAFPEALMKSPFEPGDRVNTVYGPGTIYQSGPYESWVVLDKTWVVTHVWTDMVGRRLEKPLEDVQPGCPVAWQLSQIGYDVRTVHYDPKTLSEAQDLQRALWEIHPGANYRICKTHTEAINSYEVVEATRDPIPPLVPAGCGSQAGEGKK